MKVISSTVQDNVRQNAKCMTFKDIKSIVETMIMVGNIIRHMRIQLWIKTQV